MALVPVLLVAIIMVFVKSITIPFESVNRPSSSTCKNVNNILGWAFSISSNKIKANGEVLTFSVNNPFVDPSGLPINLSILSSCWYSLMSTRIIVSLLPKYLFATAFAVCVFPTPVVPTNKKLAIGLLSFLIPIRALFNAAPI